MLADRRPAVQVNVDATAMMQAGIGDGYVGRILAQEINEFLDPRQRRRSLPVELEVRSPSTRT